MTGSQLIAVLIVDDDLYVRESLSDYLANADDMVLAGTCADGSAAIAAVAELEPDVVLMDVRMPGVDGIEATRRITGSHPATRVVALTSFGDDSAVASMFEAGASGFLLKSTRPQPLLDSIRAAHNGLAVIPPDTVQRWAGSRLQRPTPSLSVRERTVLDGLDLGLTNREIAARMFVSTSTVKAHLASLMRTLDAPTRTRVVARAHQLGILPRE